MVDLTGQSFSRLTVVGLVRRGPRHWLCKCSCGKDAEVRQDRLLAGRTKSCGCLHRELMLATTRLGHESEYDIWKAMKQRCCNPSSKDYYRYGGRGISMCQRWKLSFNAFLADMGIRPSKNHSIDRIDNDGNYEPGNCRWATASQQARNKRRDQLIEWNGQSLCVRDWERVLGFKRDVVRQRLKAGWSVEDALTAPKAVRNFH